MSLLTRFRSRVRLGRSAIGGAVVVHVGDEPTADARALAEGLPADDEHALVVVDLPPVAPLELWQALAGALPRGRGPVRVVPGGRTGEVPPYVWQWLADRVGRGVLAPYGAVVPGERSLFVHSFPESGWVTFGKGVAPKWAGKRYPRPAWDVLAVGRTRTVGMRGVAEPLPGGMWLRPDVDPDTLAEDRERLTAALPVLPGGPVIALGARGAVEVTVAEVAAFWRSLPADVAAAARFARFGGVVPADDTALGHELAEAIGAEVCVYAGLPVGDGVHVLRPDGSPGPRVLAQAHAYRPGGPATGRLVAHHPPVPGLPEVATGIYRYAPDVVIEVVRAGLWVRQADLTADPAAVRSAPLDPAHVLVVHESSDPARAERLQEAAIALMNHLDEATLPRTRIIASTVLAGAEPTAGPPALSDDATEPTSVLPPPARPDEPEPTSVLPPPKPAAPESIPPPGPDEPEPTSVLPPPRPAAPEPARARPERPVAAQAAPVAVLAPEQAEQTGQAEETDLPWLSRLMETVSIPVPVRPGDRGGVRGTR